MLTNKEVSEICKKINIPLVGVFSKNELPDFVKHGGYIINLQDSDKGYGSHWVALSINKTGKAEYFDSFGFPAPNDVDEFLRNNGFIPYTSSEKHLQNIDSGTCGYYCIAFLHYTLVRGGSLKGFLDLFSPDVGDNNRILKAFFLNL